MNEWMRFDGRFSFCGTGLDVGFLFCVVIFLFILREMAEVRIPFDSIGLDSNSYCYTLSILGTIARKTSCFKSTRVLFAMIGKVLH